MSISEYAAVKELENEHREGWGATTALWVIVAALIVIAIVYNWTRNCNEKSSILDCTCKLEWTSILY